MNIKTSILVDATAYAAWEVIGDQFGEMGEWTTAVCSTELVGELAVGSTRVCHLENAKQAEERIAKFNPEAMEVAYVAVSGTPSWLITAANHSSVEPIGHSQCRVHIKPTLKLIWWAKPLSFLMGIIIRRMMMQVGEELKYRIETGMTHPRKHAQAKP